MTTSFMSRRGVLRAGLGATLAGTITAPTVLRSQTRSLVIATTGGKTEEALKKAVFEPYTKKTGIEIVTTSTVYAKVKSMVEANAIEWDVVSADAAIAASFGAQGLLEKLDFGVIDKSALIAGVPRDHYIPFDVAAAVIGWSTKSIKSDAAPKSWAEMWDQQKYKGRRGLWKQPFQTLEIALMADGVDKDKLYPLDIERALRSLDKLKPNLYWWSTGAQSTQILLDDEVPLAMGWNGRLYDPRAEGGSLDFTLNQSLFVANAMQVLKGAKNKGAAMEFIAFALQPEQQAAYAKLIPYGPVNKNALALLPPERLKDVPSSEMNIGKGVFQDYDWWAENGGKITSRFNQWLLS